MEKKQVIRGKSYRARAKEIIAIYDQYAKTGLSNREILRRYICPKYPICEKTFYNMVNAIPYIEQTE